MERDFVPSPAPTITSPDTFEFTFDRLSNMFNNSQSLGSVDECHQVQMTQKHIITQDGVWFIKVCRYLSSDAAGIESNSQERQWANTASGLNCGPSVYQNGKKEGKEDGIQITYTYIFMERLPQKVGELLFSGMTTKEVTNLDIKAKFNHDLRVNFMDAIASSVETHMMELFNDGDLVHMDLTTDNLRVRTHQNPMDTRSFKPIEFANALFIDYGRILTRETIVSSLTEGTDLIITFPNDVAKTVFKAPIRFRDLMEVSTDEWSHRLKHEIERFLAFQQNGELERRLADNMERIREETSVNQAMTHLYNVIVGKTLEFKKVDGRYKLHKTQSFE